MMMETFPLTGAVRFSRQVPRPQPGSTSAGVPRRAAARTSAASSSVSGSPATGPRAASSFGRWWISAARSVAWSTRSYSPASARLRGVTPISRSSAVLATQGRPT